MTKLIGTSPNQVPSNADLGTAAYMDAKDFLTSRGSTLSTIDAIIPKTASDVFIYDTRKDSDGGAWRKRTQNTSWYNERVNTKTRGRRREFPTVAVIVAEANRIAIYDGDDMSLPMWMRFEAGGILDWATSSQTRICVTALNGQMVEGGNDGGNIFNFIEDYVYVLYSSNNYPITSSRTIEGRNDPGTYISATGMAEDVYVLAFYDMHDVDMAVLPGASIDSATGLPVPTIAVATDNGVSVINDKGRVINIYVNNGTYSYANKVNFLEDGSLGMSIGTDSRVAQESYYIFNSIPQSHNQITVDQKTGTVQNVDEFYAIQHPSTTLDMQVLGLDTDRRIHSTTGNSFGSSKGLTIIDRKVGAPDKGLLSYISSDYNTGWMIGQTKLSALSDTSGDQISSNNFVTNGDMSTSDTSSFIPYNSGTLQASVSITGGELKLTHTGTTNYAFARVIFEAEIGQVYTVKGRLKNGNASYAHVKPHSGCTLNPSEKTHGGTSYEDFHFTVTATSTSVQFRLQLVGSNGQYVYFDDVVAKRAVADRTLHNNNALEVYGTVHKFPVAAGAELVAYRAKTSGGDYLRQPSAGGLTLTSDFSITWWQKYNGGGGVYEGWQIAENDISGGVAYSKVVLSAMHEISTKDYLIRGANVTGAQTTSDTIANGEWTCMTVTKTGGNISLYTNGKLSLTTPGTCSTPSNPYSLEVLRWSYQTTHYYAPHSDFALFRTSNTVPSPDQIAKIYNDEKQLFKENAKATLYGSSEIVNAVAYDQDTGLLHAGTSAGRSVFQGLCRVDNTTDAVGVTISASNGMVVEE